MQLLDSIATIRYTQCCQMHFCVAACDGDGKHCNCMSSLEYGLLYGDEIKTSVPLPHPPG